MHPETSVTGHVGIAQSVGQTNAAYSCSTCIGVQYFPGEPRLASVFWSKGWWKWWWQLDYWSYKSCKATVIPSPPTNQHPVFLQTRCPSCHPTNSVRALKGNVTSDIAKQTCEWSFNVIINPVVVSLCQQWMSTRRWHLRPVVRLRLSTFSTKMRLKSFIFKKKPQHWVEMHVWTPRAGSCPMWASGLKE